jgi:CheY-like chemotaxis protein
MKTILIADDEQDVRTIIRMRLERLQYRVLEAASGTLALELTKKERPDLVLLDWIMPGISGVELLKALRQDPATTHIPLVVMTGQDEAPEQAHGLALGAVACIMKPFSPQQLLNTIQASLKETS